MPRRPVPLRAAPSAVVLHAGGPGDWPVGHHTISFGAGWTSTFRELITDGRTMSDPSLLITRPSATDPALAPAGRQLFSILAPVPNLRRLPRDWDSDAGPYAEEILDHVRARLLPGFAPEMSYTLSPADWRRRDMVAGTPFSYAHSFVQTGPFRPRNLPRERKTSCSPAAGPCRGSVFPRC